MQEPTPPEGVVNVGGEWYYEEYAHGAGVSSVGLEDKLPDRAHRGRAQEHPRPVQALRPAAQRRLERAAACPACSLAQADSAAKNSRPSRVSSQRPSTCLKWKPPDARGQPQLVQRRLGVERRSCCRRESSARAGRRCGWCRCRSHRPAASGRPSPRRSASTADVLRVVLAVGQRRGNDLGRVMVGKIEAVCRSAVAV